MLLLCGIAVAQSEVRGNTLVDGTTQVDSQYSRNIQIFVVFPPGSANADNGSFRAMLPLTPSIDGFTVQVAWSNIESGALPTTNHSNCVSWPGYNTDTCVLDSVGRYHAYSWATIDNRSDPGIWQWFDQFPIGKNKIVNILFFGMSGPTNGVQKTTPDYVTNPAYKSLFGTRGQDVINSIQNACTNWTGHSMANGSMTRAPTSSIVTAALSQHGYATNDTIWVNNVTPAAYNTGIGGKTVTFVDSNHFTYDSGQVSGGAGDFNTGGNLISASESWVVPYELPYLTAYHAALTALFLHFKSGYQANGSDASSQLGYIRFGHSVGAEAFAYCTSVLAALPSPYEYVSTSASTQCSTHPADCVGWTDDYYAGNMQWAQLQHPFMKIYGPLNQVNSDNAYGTREAAAAAGSTNGGGFFDGFGSQGLSLLDATSCGTASSGWCNAFGSWYTHGSPLELQQISLSDPNDGNCTSQSPNWPTSGCGTPPDDSGDLRGWLPFATSNHLTVLELYYRDAALAFDPSYCTLNSQTSPTTCSSSYTTGQNTFLTTPLEFTFFQSVGVGASCASSLGISQTQTGAAGDCSYANAINAAHGLHTP
jgi:hypothetical protein